MIMLLHMDTTLRRLWKLGAAAFMCCFAVILAACMLALPRLSPDAEAALVEPLQSRVSPSLRALLLMPAAQMAQEETPSVGIKQATAAARGPATARNGVALTARVDEAARLARLDAQSLALKQREARLNAEIKHAARSDQEQSKQELPPSPTPPSIPSRRDRTPEEIMLRQKIEQTKGKLAALLAFDTDQHPDVVSAQDELLTQERRLQELDIAQWDKRETTTPTEAGKATRVETKVVKFDAKVLEALRAAKIASEQQAVQVEQERGALRATLADERASAAQAQPAPGVRLTDVVQAPTPSPAPPRLTWIGGLALGSPFAFLLSLLVALETVRQMLDARRATNERQPSLRL